MINDNDCIFVVDSYVGSMNSKEPLRTNTQKRLKLEVYSILYSIIGYICCTVIVVVCKGKANVLNSC